MSNYSFLKFVFGKIRLIKLIWFNSTIVRMKFDFSHKGAFANCVGLVLVKSLFEKHFENILLSTVVDCVYVYEIATRK